MIETYESHGLVEYAALVSLRSDEREMNENENENEKEDKAGKRCYLPHSNAFASGGHSLRFRVFLFYTMGRITSTRHPISFLASIKTQFKYYLFFNFKFLMGLEPNPNNKLLTQYPLKKILNGK